MKCYPKGVHEAAYTYLMHLAHGGVVHSALSGICWNLNQALLGPGYEQTVCGYKYCEEVFDALGLDGDFPLGPGSYNILNLWHDEWGVKRRELCARMAAYIKDTYL